MRLLGAFRTVLLARSTALLLVVDRPQAMAQSRFSLARVEQRGRQQVI